MKNLKDETLKTIRKLESHREKTLRGNHEIYKSETSRTDSSEVCRPFWKSRGILRRGV